MTVRQRSASTLISGKHRAELVADPTLGAGNFFHRIATSPDRVVDQPIVWTDRPWHSPWGDTYEQFSLLELKRVSDWYAGWYSRLGVRPRDPVAVFTHSAVDLLASYVALTGLGAIAVLINGSLPPEIVADYVRRIGVTGFVTDGERYDAIRPLVEKDGFFLRSIHPLPAHEGGEPPRGYPYVHTEKDPVLITHSSGTTGVPKAVLMQHGNFFHAVRYRLGMPVPYGSERILSSLPGSHNSAITMCMFALLHGIPIKLMSTQHADAVLREIETFKPSLVAGFSKTFADLSEKELSAYDLSSMRMWWNSGDAAHESYIRKLLAVGSHPTVDREGTRLVPGSAFTDGLGSSEMGHSLFYNVHRTETARFGRCVGQPFKFVEAVVLSEEGQPLPPLQVGRLGVKSPTITSGYWNDSLLTWRSHLAGYWLTGDLVYRDEEGWFYHVDRLTDAIQTEAGMVYSLQVEELLMAAHPELVDCTVIGVPSEDKARTEAYAFLQMRTEDAVDPAEWLRRVNGTLSQRKLLPLAKVIQVHKGELPVGVTGKVKKRELRARCQEFLARARPPTRPAVAATA
ncbi:MAG: class I adenylate-forming enzyme family protein [Hyalangium sp.]|uniref:class I adenylate-forming enzyme family protein n=1 Tax=Hyalangium sp. TaxID=2028555 RepID=UPI00389A6DF5